jgi:carbon-monoxide dehydrogenase medium subunit
MLAEFFYRAPRSRDELWRLLAETAGKGRIMAGGTDLLVGIRDGSSRPSLVIDIKKVPGFARLAFDPKTGLSIGPAVTINALLEDPVVPGKFPVLAAAASELASVQLRNRATVVGNIVNASPCADMAPPLLCLKASAIIASASGVREVRLADFFTGVKKTVLKPGELMERILIPAETAGCRGGFLKLKRIKGHDLGIISVALVRQGKVLRVAIGSAAPTPVLLPELPASASAEAVTREALKAIKPIDDVRCTREYREFMVGVFIKRLLERN